jgi:hypothetical protein
VFDDPIAAVFKVQSTDSTDGYASGEIAGSGFVAIVGNRFLNDVNEKGPMTSAGAFGSVWPHDHEGDIANQRTRVTTTKTALLNPGGAGTDMLELGAGDFWYDGTPESAVNAGFDLVEITRASGDVEVYVIRLLDTGNSLRCRVVNLSGSKPNFAVVGENVNARWISTTFWQGPSRQIQELLLGSNVDVGGLGGFQYFAPPRFRTTDVSAAAAGKFAEIGAEAWDPAATALAWSGFAVDASTGLPGFSAGLALGVGTLRGDGSVKAARRSEFGLIKPDVVTAPTTGPFTWDPRDGSTLIVTWTTAGNFLDVDLDTAYLADVKEGDKITVIAVQDATVGDNLLGLSPAPNFRYSSVLDGGISEVPDNVTKFTGIWVAGGINAFLITKDVYIP